ncbi:hypothetical protein PROSTU_02216 [Providencia stuartii ATCC 25827]|uniref:Uncharacterized protein n=1 Tax=Providencia stuartii ATCC 25827 TaxID=471874 RepID=A0AA86YIM0_PROST|nr:hypothetical protein PROSTU_02216 [Providencia stuartii ATCC 25827]
MVHLVAIIAARFYLYSYLPIESFYLIVKSQDTLMDIVNIKNKSSHKYHLP